MLEDQEDISLMRESEQPDQMEFIPLHFGDKLRIVNYNAQIGIITLWSRIEYVEQTLADMGVDLQPNSSKIAVIGNLYGNGIPHLLRNLLYNPQIRDIVICGSNRSGSREEILAFFTNGLKKTTSMGETVTQIAGTRRIIDDAVTPELFTAAPRFHCIGELRDQSAREELRRFLAVCSPNGDCAGERIQVDLPAVTISHFPSEPRNCNIVKNTPLEAWKELIFRLARFGHMIRLRKGDRQELQNVRVVVCNPGEDDNEQLNECGFDIDDLRQYQHDMLLGPLPDDQAYTYGNRIRQYYGFDSLEKFAERLRNNPQDRDCYLALWDSKRDIDADDSPCLVSLFFRVFDERLTLTATYRTHNALDAWLKNVYGLMAAQKIVSKDCGIPIGPLTVISHSISIDPSKYDLAQRVANSKGFSLEMDSNGQFLVSVEGGEIVVYHTTDDGAVLNEYRGKKAERIQHELNRDCAISDINHAMYIGRQLARAEICLNNGEEYREE